MRTFKCEVKKIWKAQTKKKRAALNSKINYVTAQLKSIHNAGKVKSLSPHVIQSRKRITIELAKRKARSLALLVQGRRHGAEGQVHRS